MAESDSSPGQRRTPGRGAYWTSWVIGAIPMLLLLFSAAMKFARSKEVVDGFTHLGWPDTLAVQIGITELAAALLYLFPRTAVLGAILVTGYMGGAIATHVRIGEPFYTQAAVGVIAWLGLFLRDAGLRALVPLVSK